jgi:hypothetical protein
MNNRSTRRRENKVHVNNKANHHKREAARETDEEENRGTDLTAKAKVPKTICRRGNLIQQENRVHVEA